MSAYDDLKAKWRGLSKDHKETTCFNDVELAPGNFCVHIHDEGHSGPCGSCIETTGFFEDAKDALGFYRFAEVPRLLEWLSGAERGESPGEAETYLPVFDEGDRTELERLLGLMDETLRTDAVQPEKLVAIQALHNSLFKDTNPMNQILAWGSVGELLASPFFGEKLREQITEDDTDASSAVELKEVLDAGRFDEADNQHLALAAEFLEDCASF